MADPSLLKTAAQLTLDPRLAALVIRGHEDLAAKIIAQPSGVPMQLSADEMLAVRESIDAPWAMWTLRDGEANFIREIIPK